MNTNNAALQGLRALLSLLSQPAVSDEVDRLFGDRNPLTTTGTSVTTSTTTATVPTVTASATADSSSVTVAPASAAVVPVSTASVTIQTPNVRNIGPLFNPASILTADRGRGRGRGRGRSRGRGREHTAPYTSPGPVFTRIVVLLSGPGVEDVPRGRERQQIRDGNFEARVSFRNRMTPQEVRTSILHAFQAQGHLRTVTDCSQFDFLNCDEVNKRKLVQLDPPSQNPTATTLKSLWRSQCPIYIRPHFSLRNTTQAMPSSTSLRASPGFLFRQNIQSLLGQSLSNQNQATNIVSAIHRDTPTRNASAAYTTTTITNTSNTLTRNAGTHVHMENTGHIPAAGTNTSHSMNSGNSHTTSTTPTPNTNTIVTSTTITVNARHTHTTNIGNTVPPHALLTTTAPAESSNHSTQTQVEGTAIAATVDANNDRDILFPSWDLNIDTLGGLNDSPNRRADLISLSSPTGSSHSMESIHSYSSIHSSRGSANQDLNEEDSMDGSRVAVQVLEDVVALPSSVVVEDSEVGSINEHLNQHSSQILSAFTDVAPEMFCAWQNEVYGWQHPNIITMPLELLCHQAAADMTTVLLYFSDNNACDIFRDDFCRNILSNPDFIEACNNVYFWATECCSESAEIQGTLQLPTTTPMLAAICHNASGTAMPPFLLTNLCDIQVVITFILAAVERQQVQSTIRSNREIRQRQDEAYQENLAIDRERDHRRLVEEETMERRRVAAEANQHEIREALNQLQEEPLENVDTVRVRIRGPQGRTVQRTFFTTDTTEVLFLAAFALLALPSQHFRLRGSVATSETTSCIVIENNGLSLSELLQGDTTLSVEMTDEE